MEKELKIFKNPEFGQIRVIEQDKGLWFIVADVCRILEIGNPSDAVSRLDSDERTLVSIEGASNGKPVNAVNENLHVCSNFNRFRVHLHIILHSIYFTALAAWSKCWYALIEAAAVETASSEL